MIYFFTHILDLLLLNICMVIFFPNYDVNIEFQNMNFCEKVKKYFCPLFRFWLYVRWYLEKKDI